jgi:ATP-binding cassette subfamily B (MDR/TAP) protein 1
MMSSQAIGQNAGFMGDADQAQTAAKRIFKIVDRRPTIDSTSRDGIKEKPVTVSGNTGEIDAKDIDFAYPTRSNIKILKKFTLDIKSGETVAFCGPSGGGKSTIVSLVQRFYDPQAGELTLDGVRLDEYNIKFLRDQMGLVGQEPVLFTGSIAENIAYGLPGATREQIVEACKMSNAHNFISNFPEGYDTSVGTKGHELSGGQKQRIAIARAIIKDPSILLLDEATSALDSESERIVQEALDTLLTVRRRTTLIVAHRLSTIRNADKICVISGGCVAECGTDAELMALNGIYADLVSHADEHEK